MSKMLMFFILTLSLHFNVYAGGAKASLGSGAEQACDWHLISAEEKQERLTKQLQELKSKLSKSQFEAYKAWGKKFNAAVNTMATRLNFKMSDAGVKAAVIGRPGQDFTDRNNKGVFEDAKTNKKQAQKYSHVGFVIADPELSQDSAPLYKVFHLLNVCSGPSSYVTFEERGLSGFWHQEVSSLDVSVSYLSDEIAAKLQDLIFSSDEKFKSVHNSVYNGISNPYDSSFQNSNEFVLNMIFAAQLGETNLDRIQRAIEASNFNGTYVNLSFMEKLGLGTGVGKPGNFHNSDAKNPGRPLFVSAISVHNYISDNPEIGREMFEICPLVNNKERCNSPLEKIIGPKVKID